MGAIEKQSKSIKGGKRHGAGRKVGVPNKRTAAVQKAVQAGGITPLDYMLQVMRSNPDPDADVKEFLAAAMLRFEAAKAAAPYVHAKLASVNVQNEHSGQIQFGWLS